MLLPSAHSHASILSVNERAQSSHSPVVEHFTGLLTEARTDGSRSLEGFSSGNWDSTIKSSSFYGVYPVRRIGDIVAVSVSSSSLTRLSTSLSGSVINKPSIQSLCDPTHANNKQTPFRPLHTLATSNSPKSCQLLSAVSVQPATIFREPLFSSTFTAVDQGCMILQASRTWPTVVHLWQSVWKID
jgi:hypothetical protein